MTQGELCLTWLHLRSVGSLDDLMEFMIRLNKHLGTRGVTSLKRVTFGLGSGTFWSTTGTFGIGRLGSGTK